MTSCRSAVSASVFVAVGALMLSACSSEKPSGLPVFTPSPSASASPKSTSKWTAEQQQVIDGYGEFNNFTTAISTKAEKISPAKAHKVATDPFLTKYLRNLQIGLSAGFVQEGKIVNTISSVTVAGDTAAIKSCLDATHTKFVNKANPSVPNSQIPPPARVEVSMVRKADSWLVAGLKQVEGTCVSG